jgi:hypothetical protein
MKKNFLQGKKMKHNFECNRFCGENECNEKQNENPMLCKRVTDNLHIEQPSEEFKFWYERHFLQSPSLCKLEYDDEKMWEAWKESQEFHSKQTKEVNE